MIGLRITLTKKANKDEATIYKYILEKFGESYADRFREKLLDIFYLLSKQPFIGRPAKNKATLIKSIYFQQTKQNCL